jgi:hypothetical protein
VDNSLQEIAGSFTFLGMNTKWLATLAIAILPTVMVVPQSVASTPNCVGSNCEITFTYTGEHQVWTPPPGTADLRFEIYGAVGGRGGAGGKVTGTFTQVPDSLFIFIGGAGAMGSGVAGGFNGGGFSGGNSGTEGSGGGATDIRLDLDLTSRIVVAGGGGGGGGEAGGNGGHGGLEIAAHGGSGQASGGGGGNQLEGGFRGVNNGGYQFATAGQFGLGGSGGFSTFAGGGGGGGGWYGGGGGGADDNTCCSDGGGGGGGSSYANTEYVTNVAHNAGVSWGHGWLTLRYKIVPTISYFEIIQVNSERAVFTLEATQNVVGLEQDDFVLTGAGCEITEFSTDGTLAFGAITGCESGEVSLTLNQQSFGQLEFGPPSPVTASLFFDGTGPEFAFTSTAFVSSASEQVIDFQVSDNLQLDPNFFTIEGCSDLAIEGSQALLAGCQEGVATLTLLENSLSDSWQNLSPTEPISLSFVIDQTAPTATWSAIAITGTGPFSYSAILMFSEPVSVSNLAIAFASTAGCESELEEFAQEVKVSASCGHGNLEWSAAGLARDAAGNQLEISALSVQVSNPAPVIPAAPQPVVVPVIPTPPPAPVIVAPAPIEEENPVTSSPEADQSVQPETKSDLVTIIWPPAAASPSVPQASNVQSDSVVLESELAQEPEEELLLESDDSALVTEPVAQPSPIMEEQPLAQQVLGEELPLSEPAFPWWQVALLLGIAVLGIGAWRLSGR